MNDQLNFSKDSIYREGYGIVAKTVMRNRELSPESKAIYSYICSFAGSGTTAFPSAELMMHELNMGDKRFYKFRKELVDKGYITIIKQRNGNRRDKNIYQLETEPSKVLQHRQFESVQNESIQFESVQSESVQNEGSNNNSINSNSINSNSRNNNNYYDDDVFSILKYAEERNFILSAIQSQKILQDVKQFSLNEVKKALDISDDAGKRFYSYYKSTLQNIRANGEIEVNKDGIARKPTKNTESEGPQYNFDSLYGK